jgi:hypothetical protein
VVPYEAENSLPTLTACEPHTALQVARAGSTFGKCSAAAWVILFSYRVTECKLRGDGSGSFFRRPTITIVLDGLAWPSDDDVRNTDGALKDDLQTPPA